MKLIRKILSFGFQEKAYVVLLGLILLTCLVPLYGLTRYAIPFYDDYNYARPVWIYYTLSGSTLKAAVVGAMRNAFTMRYAWQGTYGSIFMMGLVPMIFGEQYYFLGPVFLITIFVLSIFTFVGVLVRKVFEGSVWTMLGMQFGTATLFLLLIYTAQQGFYWYNGGVHYIGMFSFMLLYLSLLIALLYGGSKKWLTILGVILSLPLAFFVAGANFITVLQTPLVALSILAAVALLSKNKRVLLWLPSLLVYALGFYFNVSAPGNKVRAAFYVGRALPPVRAVLASFPEAIRFAREFLDWRTILIYAMLIPVVWRLVKTDKIKFRLWVFPLLAVWSFCLYASTCTPGLYGTGANDLSRSINLIKITFQAVLLLNMVYAFGLIRTYLPKLPDFRVSWVAVLCWLFVWCFFYKISPDRIGQYSAYGAHYYLTSGEAKAFHEQYDNRLALLRSDQSDIVFEPYSVRPWFLIWKDISDDPMAEENQSIKAYYGKTSVIAGQ
ncbi:MAG: hypothetical protein IJL09_00435 [Lachnospiraceae bacterium]|nr:hypothetical protein [Lachnospiraceae bacterium]